MKQALQQVLPISKRILCSVSKNHSETKLSEAKTLALWFLLTHRAMLYAIYFAPPDQDRGILFGALLF